VLDEFIWNSYNIQCRLVAGKVAEAVGAGKLMLATNISGVQEQTRAICVTGFKYGQVRCINGCYGTIYGGIASKDSAAPLLR